MTTRTRKWTMLAVMVALDVVLSPLFRVEGMAPMSSVVNILAACIMGPVYTTIMAVACAIIRMIMMGIPPLALTGAVFGAALAGIFYVMTRRTWGAAVGEIIGTGIIGSLLSYPVMVWFTGTHNGLYWFLYTPRFIGATLIGTVVSLIVLNRLLKIQMIRDLQMMFIGGKQ